MAGDEEADGLGWRAMREGGGAGRYGAGRGNAHNPMGGDGGEGWEWTLCKGTEGTGGRMRSPILTYRGRGKEGDRGAWCFGLRPPHPLNPHRRPANRTRHRATSCICGHPPHPSPPPPSAGGHTLFLKIPHLKKFLVKCKLWERSIIFVYSNVVFSLHNGGLCIAGFT